MSDAKTAVAFVYQRAGQDVLTEQEIRHHVSMDLRWFEPTEARTFVERCRERDLLEEVEEGLAPTFDVRGVDVPIGFRPRIRGSGSAVDDVVDRIVDATERDREDVVARIHEEQSAFGDLLDPVVAGFIVARERSVNVDDLLEAYLEERVAA